MSAMFEEIQQSLERLAVEYDAQHAFEDHVDERMLGRAEGLREAAEIVQAVMLIWTKRCTAVLWHGPGHQSKTLCQVRGPHEVHVAVYGSLRQEAHWRDEEAMTGFFDEPPQGEDDE